MWVISGGVLAAYLEQQRDPTPITPGRGAFTGFVSGLIGAVIWLIASLVRNALMAPFQRRLEGDFMRSARDIPPEIRAMIEWFGANPFLLVALGFVVFLCVGAIFSTLGGVLGAAFFRNDVPPALGGPTAPPPLPPL